MKDVIERHNPQVIEFDGLKFTNKELKHCKELGILSMPYYTGSKLSVLKKLIDSGADILNLGNPKLIEKIIIDDKLRMTHKSIIVLLLIYSKTNLISPSPP